MMRFGQLMDYEVKEQEVLLSFADGKARIQVVTPEIIRVFAGFEDDGSFSNAIEQMPAEAVAIQTDLSTEGLQIRTPALEIRVSEDFLVDFYDLQGRPISLAYRGSRQMLKRRSEAIRMLLESEGHSCEDEDRNHPVQVVRQMLGTEAFYGLGDKTGYLNKRGYDYVNWNTDNPQAHTDAFKALYKSIPFLITKTETHTCGYFFDNPYKTWFDLGKESEEYYWFGADDGNLDYYMIVGSDMKTVVQGYTRLTGTCPVPQKWTLGYHQSRWGYMNWEDIRQIAHNMRKYRIPCDVIHFDIDYMQDYRVFTWDMDRYAQNPKGCLEQLARDGFKAVAIIDPGVKQEEGYEIYDEGVRKGYFAKDPQGEIYVNTVWPGKAVYPDFGHSAVRRWWGDLQKKQLESGIRGTWNDMNEPASFTGPLPEDVVFSENDKPVPHKKAHNVYGHNMAKATYEGLRRHDGRRPFVITRACYAGTQKYSTVWTGDNQSLWVHLQMAIPQLCNLGLSGMSFAGTDIGGFGEDTTPELLTRWIQVGCFSPLCRNHAAGGTRPQEPWVFGDRVTDIYRKFVTLRYRLLPYIYDLFFEGERTGLPVMRPLVLEYPEDPEVAQMNDEFMLGSQILVAPVVCQGMTRRMVYLPEGTWYDYWTGEKTEGGRWFMKEVPLEDCPVYVKAGTLLPVAAPMQYVGEKEAEEVLLEVYPGIGSWDHYEDNGEDFAYRDGDYEHYHCLQTADGQVVISQGPEGKALTKRVVLLKITASSRKA